MDLLEDLKMSLLCFNFVMIYITHKILVFLKNKDSILQCFFKELMDFNFFFKKIFFFKTYNHGNFKSWKRKDNWRYKKLFQTKKTELNYTVIKDIRNLFQLEKETKAIKDKVFWDTKNLFEHEKNGNYYKPVRVSNFWSKKYIENESNSDGNKTLSVEKYLNKIRSNLKDIINNLKKSDSWKIQLMIANNFISAIDNDEEHVMHSKNDNIEIMINDEADEVIK